MRVCDFTYALEYVEFATPAVFHATDYALGPLDRVQNRMLEEIGITAENALFEFSLSPLRARRDMAMLGLIHRVKLNEAPTIFSEFIFPASSANFPRSFRAVDLRHNSQMQDPVNSMSSRLFHRSIFGLIYTYNLLPQAVINCESVSSFQNNLQRALKEAVKHNCTNWDSLYSHGIKRMSVSSFQALFVKSSSPNV